MPLDRAHRNSIIAHFGLARPVNCAIASASVLVGSGLSGPVTDAGRVLAAGLSAACIAGGGNALNDACDEAADRINRPGRPIPSGRATKRGAVAMAVCLFALGLSLGAGLGSGLFAIAMAATLGLAAYDLVLRRVPLLGNLTVSGIGALALIYGGAAAGHAESALVPAGFAFLFHLGREILKDLEDVTGDAAAGAGSLALAWGPRRTLGLITAIYLLLAGLIPVPYWLELYGWPYLVLVLVPVDGILAYVLIAMWRDRSVRNLRFLDRLLKTGMVFGLVALWVGRK